MVNESQRQLKDFGVYRLRQNNERVEDARSEHQIVKEAFEEPRIQHAEKDVVYLLTTVNVNEEVYIEEVKANCMATDQIVE